MKDFRPPGRTRTSEITRALAFRAALMAALAVAPAAPAGAQAPAFLVKDINPRTIAESSNPRDFFTIGRITFFIAGELGHDSLWKTDGNADGTERLTPDLDTIDAFTDVSGVLYFTASAFTPPTGRQRTLWKSDGTPQSTVPVREIRGSAAFFTAVGDTLFFFAGDQDATALGRSDGTGAGTELIKRFDSVTDAGEFCGAATAAQINGRLVFAAAENTTGCEVWRSDGTPNGTMLLADIVPGPRSSHPEVVTRLGGVLVFSAANGPETSERSLWATDGTAAGTRILGGTAPPVTLSGSFAVLGDTLYFRGGAPERAQLWKTDGTPAGTALVKDVESELLIASDHHLYFAAPARQEGSITLWISDGTATGTTPIGNLDPAGITLLATAGDLLFFRSGDDLWRSDGTADGTYSLVTLDRGSGTGTQLDPQLVAGDTEAFFFTRNAADLLELWRSDGTVPGTIHLADLETNRGDLDLASSIGPLFFSGYDSDAGTELWRSDGTLEGTQRLANLAPDTIPQSSFAVGLTSFNGMLLFAASDGRTGLELWRSDGSEAGTVLVKDINPGPASGNPFLRFLGGDEGGVDVARAAVGDSLYFPADDGVHGNELWRTDGTPAGTYMVADIMPGANGSSPLDLVDGGGVLYFSAGAGLWKSDGTVAGTMQVKAFDSGPGPATLTPFNGQLFFSVGAELWRSDGTTAGTQAVHDFGPEPSRVSALAVADRTLFIGTSRPLGLWKSDGTADGTMLLTRAPNDTFGYPVLFTLVNDLLFFVEFRESYVDYPFALWRSDGTPEGTFVIDPSSPMTVTAFDGALFYGSSEALARTDGSVAGTSVIRRLTYPPGAGGRTVGARDLTDVGGHLLFESGTLWESDGTATGTRQLADVIADPPTASKFNQPSLTRVGSLVFFSASTPSTGAELWAVPVASLGLCGNQEVDPGETCDAGGETISCNADCTASACGDGIVNATAGETCDDGYGASSSCCGPTCQGFASAGSSCANRDADACNGTETCDGAGTCQSGTPLDCDDGNSATIDDCSPGSGCVHRLRYCVGDCDGDGVVSIAELVGLVEAALNSRDATACPAGDPAGDGRVTVDEIITAVGRALHGCSNTP